MVAEITSRESKQKLGGSACITLQIYVLPRLPQWRVNALNFSSLERTFLNFVYDVTSLMCFIGEGAEDVGQLGCKV
jgi:hypothetical protein